MNRALRLVCLRAALLACLGCLPSAGAGADTVTIAVAANFLGTLEKLKPVFERKTGHKLVLSGGSSGQLAAQIRAGAPYHVLLSADAERPAQLAQAGLALADSRFVYAVGLLVLWSRTPGLVDAQGKLLHAPGLSTLALADPQSAPYGAAAQQVLERLALWRTLQQQKKVVLGISVAQAYQFAASGAVQCAFVSLAQVLAGSTSGSVWRVPQALYTPLQQEAVLLERGRHSGAARAFLRWLRHDPAARALVRDAGYGLSQ